MSSPFALLALLAGWGDAVRAAAPGSDSIGAAVAWVEALLLGSLATLVAQIAVAVLGLMMLAGRLDRRHAVRVAVGCFVLLGAGTTVRAIRDGTPGVAQAVPPPVPRPAAPAPSAAAVVGLSADEAAAVARAYAQVRRDVAAFHPGARGEARVSAVRDAAGNVIAVTLSSDRLPPAVIATARASLLAQALRLGSRRAGPIALPPLVL
jgi:type IV secretion system protein VirB2